MKNKYTLITGASSGIGLEIAACMADKGHNLILTARRENILMEASKDISEKYKVKVVSSDPKETKTRQILNFGHTFGHPLESASNGKLSHGEAVSFGIRCAINHSVEQQLCSAKLAADNLKLSRSMGLDTGIKMKMPTASELRRLLGHDKKSKDGKLTLILIEKAGRPLVREGYWVNDVAKIIIANQ